MVKNSVKNIEIGTDEVPRIESIKIRNYRALQDFELEDITPLTVLLGPNGSGKSTVFDVFAFLSECLTIGLRNAWDKRGRFKELRTRGRDGPIEFQIKYRETPEMPLITYDLHIDEDEDGPFVSWETLRWKRGSWGAPFKFLDFSKGEGMVITGEMPEKDDTRVQETIDRDGLAVSALGQFKRHPRVMELRRFISGWYMSYLSADSARGTPEAGPQERLTETGNNLPNVIQYLSEREKERLTTIIDALVLRVPRLEKVEYQLLADGRLLLQIKDAPFLKPILAKFASDGTLKMLAYLTILYDPSPSPFIGIEEPENFLHPRLLPELAEECRKASSKSQLFITTHSPFFVNELKPRELWVLYRNESGYAVARRVQDMLGIAEFVEQGAKLGNLWMEGYFDVGDPLTNAGGPKQQSLLEK